MSLKALCSYCQAIDYATLPSEDEPGAPHHPSLPSLIRSAKSCGLCELLLRCAYQTRVQILEEGDKEPFIELLEGLNDRQKKIFHYGPEWREMYRKDGSDGAQAGPYTGTAVVTVLGNYAPGMPVEVTNCKPVNVPNIPPGDIWALDISAGLNYNQRFRNDESMKPWLYGSWWKSISELRNGQWRVPQPERLQLVGLGMRLGTSPRMEDAEGSSEKVVICRGTGLRLRAIAEDALATLIPGRPCSGDAGSQSALRWIRRQLQTCDQQHGLCQPEVLQLPTRILELRVVDGYVAVRLIDGAGMRDKYAALSHCWGTDHKITTTTTNLDAYKTNIDYSAFPKTFHDAITLTFELGLRYIWIDSLCIIQDDKTDWEQEAPRMADVYSNSYVTFSASHSTGTGSGLFAPSDDQRTVPSQTADNRSLGRISPGDDIPLVFDVPGLGETVNVRCYWPMQSVLYDYNGLSGKIMITQEWMPTSNKSRPREYCIGTVGREFDPLELENLNTRAWTLQERVLSPRVLHFARDQMYWECAGSFVGEDGSQFPRLKYSLKQTVGQELLPNKHCGRGWQGISLIESYAHFDKTRRGRWHGGWLQHVEDFTSRKLTNEDDKLPALSGLAEKIKSITKDNYMAGIWFQHGLEDLCWRTKPFEERRVSVRGDDDSEDCSGFEHIRGERYCHITKAAKYRAPTWSWASLNGRIEFLPVDFHNVVAHPIYAQVEPATPQLAMGNLKKGWLHIKGPLLSIRISPPGTKVDKMLPLGFGTLCETDTLTGTSQGEVYFDLEEEPKAARLSLPNLQKAMMVLSVSEDTASTKKTGLIKDEQTTQDIESTKDTKPQKDTKPGKQAVNSSFDRPSQLKLRTSSTSEPKDQPCSLFGLFIDASTCLVLKPRSVRQGRTGDMRGGNQLGRPPGGADYLPAFERVGIGNFIRTEKQIRDTPKVDVPDLGEVVSFVEGDKLGPVDEKHEAAEVIIF